MSMGGQEQKETREERELARIAAEMARDYDTRWKPIRNQMIADVRDAEPEKQQALGIANVENQMAFGAARRGAEASQSNAGAGLGSGRSVMSSEQMSDNQGAAGGSSAMDVIQASEDNRTAGMLGVAQMGRGENAEAIRGLNDVADMARSQAARDAQEAQSNAQALQSAIGLGAALTASSSRPEPKQELFGNVPTPPPSMSSTRPMSPAGSPTTGLGAYGGAGGSQYGQFPIRR